MPGQLNNQWQANEYIECTRKQPKCDNGIIMQGSTARLAVLRKASFSHASMIIFCQGHECVCNKYQEVTDINIGIELWTTHTQAHRDFLTNDANRFTKPCCLSETYGRSLSSTTQLSLTMDTAIRIVLHSIEVAHFTHKIRGTFVSSTTRDTSSTRGKHPITIFP